MFLVSDQVLFGVLTICLALTEAFFLNWGSSEPVEQSKQTWPQTQAYVYQPRYFQSGPTPVPQQPQYMVKNADVPTAPSMPIPAIPIQVPLQAQMSPAANIHNVQLVPCLCPISTEEYEKGVDNNIYTVNQNPKN